MCLLCCCLLAVQNNSNFWPQHSGDEGKLYVTIQNLLHEKQNVTLKSHRRQVVFLLAAKAGRCLCRLGAVFAETPVQMGRSTLSWQFISPLTLSHTSHTPRTDQAVCGNSSKWITLPPVSLPACLSLSLFVTISISLSHWSGLSFTGGQIHSQHRAFGKYLVHRLSSFRLPIHFNMNTCLTYCRVSMVSHLFKLLIKKGMRADRLHK